MNSHPLILRRKADRRRMVVAAPLDLIRYAVLESTLAAGYRFAPVAMSFNDWVCAVAGDETHPHYDAAIEYCDLWRRGLVH